MANPLSETNDEDLIEAARQGEPEAFSRLVRKYQDRLYASMLQVTGDPDESEDVVQEAFVRAFVKLDTFSGKSQFFTWLYRIAFNSALGNRRRKRPKTSIDEFREQSGSEPVDGGDSPDARMHQSEQVNLVRAAMQRLSEQHRKILVLREMEENSYEEIAEILEISVGTVRSRISRARSQLKIHLESLQGETNEPS